MSDGSWSPRPARGYSYEPFRKGNTVSLRHGAYSVHAITERAAEIRERVLEVAPWCDEDRYLPSVSLYLQAAARAELAHQAIMSSERPSPRLMEAASAASRLAFKMGAELGLTPAGHAKLALLAAEVNVAGQSIKDLTAKGRSLRREQPALDERGDDE